MKKRLLLLAFTAFSFIADAQKAYLFKIRLQPHHSYQSTIKSILVDLKTDAAPPVEDLTSVLDIETAPANVTGRFPLAFKQVITDSKLFGSPNPLVPEILNNRMIQAHSDANGDITVDPDGGISGEYGKGMALNELNQYQWVIFPEKALKVGDSFTCREPIHLPRNQTLVTINTTYKLVAVKNNLAYFELNDSCTIGLMDESNHSPLQGTITGTGELVFDLALSYPQSMTDKLNIDYTVFRPDNPRQIRCSLVDSSDNKITVSAN